MCSSADYLASWIKKSSVSVGIFCCILLAACGCSRSNFANAVAAANASNIQRLTNLYSSFQSDRYGPGPKDEMELKNDIKANSPDRLKAMGIDPDNLDTIWISERDHQPFKVRYKVVSGRGAVNPIVFEQDGVGGMRQVCFNGGTVEEVDDARYKELWEGKGTAKSVPIGMPPGAPSAAAPTK